MLSSKSTDQQPSRKCRHAKPRRGSVVEWINGLSDNNVSRENEWERTCSSPRLTRHGSVVSVSETLPDETTKHRIELLANLKKEVKVIMEEAVTKRQIDINSPYVTSLCVAVENCLMDGLRRRLLGLFGSRTSLALLHTVAKTNAVAEQVLAKTLEMNAHASESGFLERLLFDMFYASPDVDTRGSSYAHTIANRPSHHCLPKVRTLSNCQKLWK
ncbi:RUN domain-containing protein [Trichostrongylus colubriformis]|uniref:RUN domain-containing protein n=1 Tax=Trichostrongylus colubriformis TaxID=6319 RepID=A0AAN8IJZ2_TRICO